jgi:hypothetical protein
METISLKFSDFRIIPDIQSVHREVIDDGEYFSSKYSMFLSNSRLRWINPAEGGNPQLFLNPPKLRISALNLGTAIHASVLTPDEYYIADKIDKPSAKLGLVIDEIERLLRAKKQKFDSFDELVKTAALNVDYYSSRVDSKIDYIKGVWNDYATKLEALKEKADGKPILTLSNSDWDTAQSCVKSLKENDTIMSRLHPTNMFDEPIESYCEDALFMDYIVTYKGSQCATLRFKLKIDNWTIDEESKTITVNDLKTTGHSVDAFIEPDGSFNRLHYYRQLSIYGSILMNYLLKTRGVSKASGWTIKYNILAVETVMNNYSRCFVINDDYIHRGMDEANELLKRVAACEIFGYDKEFIFE